MSGFVLHGDGDHGHTLVPNLFLDNYMPEANGEYVKISVSSALSEVRHPGAVHRTHCQ